jgi:ribosomal protein L11 methyltransferase
MLWHEVTVHTTEEATEIVSHFMHECGAAGVSIEESSSNFKKMDSSLGQFYDFPLNDLPLGRAVVKGYFDQTNHIHDIMNQLEKSIAQIEPDVLDTGNPTITMNLVDEQDWANQWKQYFKPIIISNRLVIKPQWEEFNPNHGQIVIEIDPGMAFGTGTHASTSLCMKALEQLITGDEQVIDIGTGSGILAVTAAKLGARHVLAIDLDPIAVISAKSNVALNHMDHQVTVVHSNLLDVINGSSPQENSLVITLPVQIAVANILAEVIVTFPSEVYRILQPGGYYITSGIILSKEAMVVDALQEQGFEITSRQHEGEWVAIIARKPAV